MTSNFPLLSLPSVAGREVLSFFGPRRLFRLSVCSRKSRNFVKNVWKKNPSWHLYISAKYGLNIDVKTNQTYIQVVSHKPKFKNNKEIIEEDTFKKWKTETDYLCDLLRIDIRDVMMMKDSLWILDWIRNLNNGRPLHFLHYQDVEKLTNDEFLSLLTYPVSGRLMLYTRPPPDFKTNIIFPNNLDEFFLNPSYWVTIKNLLAMNHTVIEIHRSQLTNKDVNSFLKKWLNGSNPLLKCIMVQTKEELDIEVILNGIESNNNDEDIAIIFEFIRERDEQELVKSGHLIKRGDGIMATVFIEHSDVIRLIVWPDLKKYQYE